MQAIDIVVLQRNHASLLWVGALKGISIFINSEKTVIIGGLDVGGRHGSWYSLVWGTLGFLMFLSGFTSNNVVTMVMGAVLGLAGTSAYLTSCVKSEHIAKKAFEVVFMLLSFGVVVYGYAITGSLVLGVITLFIFVTIFLAFVVSYLLPKVYSEPKSYV